MRDLRCFAQYAVLTQIFYTWKRILRSKLASSRTDSRIVNTNWKRIMQGCRC